MRQSRLSDFLWQQRAGRALVALAVALVLVACGGGERRGAPGSPLPTPAVQQAVSPLDAPRTLVLARPRSFVPLAATSGAFAEDECSANSAAAWMLNLIRTAAWQGRAQVLCHPLLAAAAQSKADEMGRLVYAAHVSPDGVAPNDNVRAHGYPLPEWYAVGRNNVESFAAGFGYAAPEVVLAAWATSPSHWAHVAAQHPFFAAQECAAVGYSHTPGRGFFHYWVFLSAPCP